MKSVKILLVDDDNLCLLIAKKLLRVHFPEDFKYESEPFDDPVKGFDQAINYLQTIKEAGKNELIIVLLDINMPVLDGWNFLTLLAEKDPDNEIKVFMHSSSLNESDKQRALEFTRVLHYFNKPMTPEKIHLLHSKIVEIAGSTSIE